MNEQDFNEFCSQVLDEPEAEVDLTILGRRNFEQYVRFALENSLLGCRAYNYKVRPSHARIVCNRYIQACHLQQESYKNSLVFFANMFDIRLDLPYQVKYCYTNPNPLLEGLAAHEVTTQAGIEAIEAKRQDVTASLFSAIAADDVAALKPLLEQYWTILEEAKNNQQQTAFEVAIRTNKSAAFQECFQTLPFSYEAVTHDGIPMLTLMIRCGRINLLRYCMDNEYYPPLTLLAEEAEDVDDLDPIKLVIDENLPAYLIDTLKCVKFLRPGEFLYLSQAETERLKHYIDAAAKPAFHAQLKQLELSNNQAQFNFMQAIENNEYKIFEQLLNNKIAVNKQLDGQYALCLACQLQRGDMIRALLAYSRTNLNVRNQAGCAPLGIVLAQGQVAHAQWFFEDSRAVFFQFMVASRRYRPDLDPVRVALANNNVALLDYTLKFFYGEHHFFLLPTNILRKIDDFIQTLSLQPNAAVRQYYNNLCYHRANIELHFFQQVAAGNVVEVNQCLQWGVDVNVISCCETAAHVACRQGNVQMLQTLSRNKNFNPNVKLASEQTPLSVAILNQHFGCTAVLLNLRSQRLFIAIDGVERGYDECFDPIALAIKSKSPAMFEQVMRHLVQQLRTLTLNRDHLKRLLVSVKQQAATALIPIVLRWQRILELGGKLFATLPQTSDSQALDYRQSIQSSDKSVILSVIKLCKRFQIPVEYDLKTKHYHLVLPQDAQTLLDPLKGMIDRVQDHKHCAWDPKLKQYKKISLSAYQAYARSALAAVRGVGEDKYGDAYANWHSAWITQARGQPPQWRLGLGLTLTEYWIIAIKAAQDASALGEPPLSAEAMLQREALLVEALVHCERAYNMNNDNRLDSGGKSVSSCVHGMAMRPFIALAGGMHQDVNIITHPQWWATDIAKQSLHKYYKEHPERPALEGLLSLEPESLTFGQRQKLHAFYQAAKKVVYQDLVAATTDLLHQGFLSGKDYAAIVDNIMDINLPVNAAKAVPDSRQYPAFAAMQYCPQALAALGFQQRFLPIHVDVGWTALLVAARTQGYQQAPAQTPQLCRQAVYTVLAQAWHQQQALQLIQLLPDVAANHLRRASQILRRRLQNQYRLRPDAQAQVQRYLATLMTDARLDPLIMEVLALIFQAEIKLYDCYGQGVMMVTPRALMVPTSVSLQLGLMQGRAFESTKHYNLLIRGADWGLYQARVTRWLGQPSLPVANAAGLQDYEVIPGGQVAGFDQIKIPGCNNCCFNAVLVAARAAKVPAAQNYANHYELRRGVYANLKQVHAAAQKTLLAGEPLEYGMLRDQYLWARDKIRLIDDDRIEFNKENGLALATEEDYIEALGVIDSWGGGLALGAMAQLLQVNINILSESFSHSYDITTNPANPTLNLRLRGQGRGAHYNALVPPHSWVGLEPGDPIRQFDLHLPDFREAQGRDLKHWRWTKLHHAVAAGDLQEVTRLLNKGVPQLQDSRGFYPANLPVDPDLEPARQAAIAACLKQCCAILPVSVMTALVPRAEAEAEAQAQAEPPLKKRKVAGPGLKS